LPNAKRAVVHAYRLWLARRSSPRRPRPVIGRSSLRRCGTACPVNRRAAPRPPRRVKRRHMPETPRHGHLRLDAAVAHARRGHNCRIMAGVLPQRVAAASRARWRSHA
jgi:hypothetical protein